MKIAVDIRSLGSGNMTGVGHYLYNSLNNMIAKGQDFSWLLLNTGLKNLPAPIWTQANVSYRHLRLPNKIMNSASLFSVGPSIVDIADIDVDLIWLPNINFFIKKKNIPYILTVHDLSFLHSQAFYSLKRKIWHNLVGVKKLINQASALIVVSENTKRDIIRFFSVAEDKIFVVYPGVEYLKISFEEAKKVTAHLVLPDKYFLFVGTLEPRKNVLGLIKAFDRLHNEHPDYSLVLVGGHGWMYGGLLKEIKKRKYIQYLGYQKNPIKDAIYKLSYAFIWPSFYEGFGFPPLEAMAHKKPVIASYKTSLPEILKNKAIYIDPYNVADMFQAMKVLIEDQDLYRSMITENNYSLDWGQQSQDILNIFKKVITKN
jgi:glycosyltransferase involved in cell wall biosynthesis